jgi:hypothetical protein
MAGTIAPHTAIYSNLLTCPSINKLMAALCPQTDELNAENAL